jgi:WD40 repeat protein
LLGSINSSYAPFVGHTNKVFDIVISSDDKLVVSGSADKTIRIWDIDSGKDLQNLKGHSD